MLIKRRLKERREQVKRLRLPGNIRLFDYLRTG